MISEWLRGKVLSWGAMRQRNFLKAAATVLLQGRRQSPNVARTALLAILAIVCGFPSAARSPLFRALVVSTRAADHAAMIAAATPHLREMAARGGFAVDFTQDVGQIDDLSRYDVLVQLHIAPFEIPAVQHAAFERFIAKGKG